MTPHEARITWPVVAVVLAGAVAVLAGGLIAWLSPAQLLPAGTPVTTGVQLYGARMAARALPLGLALLALLALRANRMLAALLVLIAAIEIGDCISALVNRDWPQLSGAVIAVAFLWAAARLTGPAWPPSSWSRRRSPTRAVDEPTTQ
jgi:hypothetical protein